MSEQDPAGESATMQPSPRVADEWLRRVEAEYSSAAITQELVLWLIRLGAPPELITDGLRIVEDELAHATASHAVATEAGSDARPALAQENLGLPRSPSRPLVADVAHHGVEVFCLGETVAVPLFVAMRERCTVPVARAALDRIVRDEVRHRDFGWHLLDWLLDVGGAPIRTFVQTNLAAMLGRVRRNYGTTSPTMAPSDSLGPNDHAWGLIPTARYGRILERCIERDYTPRFARVGITIPSDV